MLYLFVTAYENGISLVKSAVVGIKESGNFEDLLKEALSNELFLEDKLVKVDLQCNDSSAWHPILNGLTENLEACFQLKAQHVRFTISHSILIPDELSNEGSSAFNFMMTQQRLKKLPPLYNSQFRNDLLYNDFLKILQERKLGWLNDNHLTIGHSFIRRVTDLVWYLDPHLGKLEKRGLKLPKIIAKLPVYASESHYNLYHDTTKHKKIEISREKLESFVKALILSIQQPWTRLLHWEEVIKDIDDLIKIAQEYANYLQGVNNRMRTIHTSLVPVRNGRDDITVEDIEAVDLYPSQYEFLAQLLRESNDYDLLNIDHLLPPKPQNIYLFFQNICADVSFTLYRYYHGNYLGTLNFVWKIPSLDKCDKTKEAKNISAAYDQIPIYCTRQMRKNVINKYSLIVKASRSILQVLYQDLTGDVSTPDNEINKKTHERIKLMLDTQDPDIIIDLPAVRTAPYHSWANPAERIMSILNLALQGVALKREDMSGLSEQAFEKLKTLSEIREGANSNSHLKEELIKSIKITQEFLENRTSRLSLHDLKFKIASPAIETEIDSLFESILTAESQLTINDTTLVELRKFHKLKEFIDTHCQIRQYSFQIKKCNNSECTICLPVELPIEVFDELHFLPDPEPSIADSNHYKVV
ncbi:unnamed protein product [Rhizophagus irregularis]|nr:unnamed protein product [Rhizophagus irregularis]